jgi:hypothetical protein
VKNRPDLARQSADSRQFLHPFMSSIRQP